MADNTDIRDHAETYASVITLLKWGALAAFIIGMLVVWLIAPAGK